MTLALITTLRHGALWEAMRARGWNQRQLAEHVGLDQTRLSALLRFKWIPTKPEVRARLEALTGLLWEDLFPPAMVASLGLIPTEHETMRDVTSQQLDAALRREAPPLLEAQVLEAEDREILDLARRRLSLRQQEIIARRYGLDNQDSQTLAEIGAAMGISGARVREIEAAALRKLRDNRPLTLHIAGRL